MTEDDIIRMAREAGFYGSEILGDHEYDVVGLVSDLERFANLVAADEREACAKVCEEYAHKYAKDDDDSKAQAWMMLQCAAAIRARGLDNLNKEAEQNGEQL